MQLKRVVITGLGAVSPFGHDVESLMEGIEKRRNAVRLMEGWDCYTGLRSHVAAPAEIRDERKIPRHKRRFMGRMSVFSAQAAEQALTDAGIDPSGLRQIRIGCAIGSTMGSAKSINDAFELMLPGKDISRLNSSMFFRCMSHTAAANVAQYLELEGHTIAPSAACASALHAIGAGYDIVRLDRQDVMLCGGAEEVHPTVTGSFDVLMATSAGFNNAPSKTPRPFDRDRDGLVCGEGSGVLVLEEYERALRRGARIYAEITGYHTNGNGSHVSQSHKGSMVRCMERAMDDAGVTPADIDYINAHATATLQGDQEEAEAIREVFGASVPVSSLKGYIGHTLGASGAIELIATLLMMQRGVVYPTLNLENISPECLGIDHITEARGKKLDVVLKNCFAFGGINAALVCRKL
jgi:3-oxoacyl-[acyl-carrier-protein] synthase II